MNKFDMLLNEIVEKPQEKEKKKEDNMREIIVRYKAGDEENPVIVKNMDNNDDCYALAYVMAKFLADSTGVDKEETAQAIIKAMLKVMTNKITDIFMEEILK